MTKAIFNSLELVKGNRFQFNKNIIYSGGVAGGLFISVNNGKNWQASL